MHYMLYISCPGHFGPGVFYEALYFCEIMYCFVSVNIFCKIYLAFSHISHTLGLNTFDKHIRLLMNHCSSIFFFILSKFMQVKLLFV